METASPRYRGKHSPMWKTIAWSGPSVIPKREQVAEYCPGLSNEIFHSPVASAFHKLFTSRRICLRSLRLAVVPRFIKFFKLSCNYTSSYEQPKLTLIQLLTQLRTRHLTSDCPELICGLSDFAAAFSAIVSPVVMRLPATCNSSLRLSTNRMLPAPYNSNEVQVIKLRFDVRRSTTEHKRRKKG